MTGKPQFLAAQSIYQLDQQFVSLWSAKMASQMITLELPDNLYRTVSKLAQATKRPLAEILQESLAHTLPPLDDVPADEVDVLVSMSALDDAALWQASKITLAEPQQEELHALLDRQNAGELTPDNAVRLQDLMDEYGRLLVRQSHAWLLLARRGYQAPIQQQQE
jgi:predicted transcriptional regulator